MPNPHDIYLGETERIRKAREEFSAKTRALLDLSRQMDKEVAKASGLYRGNVTDQAGPATEQPGEESKET